MTVVDSVRPHALPSAPMTGPGAERPARDRIPRISGPALIAGARRAAPAVAVIGLVAGLVVLFAGPLGEGSAAHRRAVAEQAVNDELRARIAAGEREIALLDDRTFLDQLARSWMLAGERERGFSLAPGAPAPIDVIPVGEVSGSDGSPGFLDDLVRTIAGA